MVIYILFSQLLAIYYLKYLMVHKYCFCSQSIEYDYICVFNVVVYPLSLPSSSSCLFSHERLWIFQIFPIYVNSTMYLKIPYFLRISWYDEFSLHISLEIYCYISYGNKIENYLLVALFMIDWTISKENCIFIQPFLFQF